MVVVTTPMRYAKKVIDNINVMGISSSLSLLNSSHLIIFIILASYISISLLSVLAVYSARAQDIPQEMERN